MKKILAMLLLVNLCTGCVTYKYDKSLASIQNDKYKVSIDMEKTPIRNGAWVTIPNAYLLKTTNFTDDHIEIDWTKTSFISDGQTDGGFMKAGELFINRDLPKNPTIVMPRATQKLLIYPSTLIDASNYQAEIPEGKNGVYLVMKIGDKEYTEQLYITKTAE